MGSAGSGGQILKSDQGNVLFIDNDGNISVLKLGDKTTFDYSFKNENK